MTATATPGSHTPQVSAGYGDRRISLPCDASTFGNGTRSDVPSVSIAA